MAIMGWIDHFRRDPFDYVDLPLLVWMHLKRHFVDMLLTLPPAGAKVFADAGLEEGPREVLEATGAADGGQPSLFQPAHLLRQPAKKRRPVCAGPCADRRPG